MTPVSTLRTVTAEEARLLLLDLQGLLVDPARRATPLTVGRHIEDLGFVQLDSINVLERAHHLTLAARFDGYQPEHLRTLIETKRTLFEHWTHDASVIPTRWFPAWRLRCRQMTERPRVVAWVRGKIGRQYRNVLAAVLERIEEEGPLASRDFEAPSIRRGTSAWWGWKPAKAALEFLWWRGDLSVTRRVGFQKMYDLTERVYPEHVAREEPTREALIDWACGAALERLGVATPAELAGYWASVTLGEARAWSRAAIEVGAAQDVRVEAVAAAEGAAPRRGVARCDWRRIVGRARRRLSRVADRMRLLAPFDPVLRDRRRAERLFGFFYRFEAFVPAPKRIYGYYVLPLLEGDRLVGRADLKFDRPRRTLHVRGLWWEAGVKVDRARRARFDAALARMQRLIGAERIRRSL